MTTHWLQLSELYTQRLRLGGYTTDVFALVIVLGVHCRRYGTGLAMRMRMRNTHNIG